MHLDQSDGLEFEIQDVWKSTKEDFAPLKDHIAVVRHRANQISGDNDA